VPNLLGGLQQQ